MIRIENVSFRYGNTEGAGQLRNIDLEIGDGETVLLAGTSGSGKSTLTRLINGLIPHYFEGNLEGRVTVDGKDVKDTPLFDMAETCGSLFQNPRSQFFNVDTTSELSFACENMGMPEPEIRERVRKTARDLDVEYLMGRSIFRLSGGEKQKIAAASISVLSPSVMVLDEPTSNLDSASVRKLRDVIAWWKSNGKTVLVAEHRLSFMKGLADRVIYLKEGKIEGEWSGEEFFSMPASFFRERGLRTGLLRDGHVPDTGDHGRITVSNMVYRWKDGTEVLDIPSLEIGKGRVTAVIGRNGAGKTTFARSLCGLLRHDRSTVTVDGRTYRRRGRLGLCYQVMQDVNHQLFTEDVLDEVLLSMEDEDESRAMEILASLGLSGKEKLHPMSLSGGEKQRVAIASALASGRGIIVFDEPTSGLDLSHMEEVAECIRLLRKEGRTVLVVTHDPELISASCDDVLMIERGKAVYSHPLDDEGRERTLEFFRGEES